MAFFMNLCVFLWKSEGVGNQCLVKGRGRADCLMTWRFTSSVRQDVCLTTVPTCFSNMMIIAPRRVDDARCFSSANFHAQVTHHNNYRMNCKPKKNHMGLLGCGTKTAPPSLLHSRIVVWEHRAASDKLLSTCVSAT